MSMQKCDINSFVDNSILNVELEHGCTCMEILPTPNIGADTIVQAVEGAGQVQDNGMVNVIAGCEDGSIVMVDMHVPDPEDGHIGQRQEDFKGRGSGSKPRRRQREMTIQHSNDDKPRKPSEINYLHKEAVTAIKQRPSYPFQFLTTSLDGEANLCMLTASILQEELVILKFSNKICDEGIGDADWMDPNCFIAKNDCYGQLLLQDVREGEGKSATHLYTTPTYCKINDMDVSFPYIGLAQDDGTL